MPDNREDVETVEDTELVDVSEVAELPEDEVNRPKTLPANVPVTSEELPTEFGSRTTIANLRQRFAAFIIDSLILFYLYWALGMIIGRFTKGSWDTPLPSYGNPGLALNAGFVLLMFLYYFVSEGIFYATPGKFLCWMYVRKKDGDLASMTSVFFRNIFRFFDYAIPFVPFISMELTRARQRIGDLISGTTVVKKHAKVESLYIINMSNIASASGRFLSSLIDIAIFATLTFGYLLLISPDHPVFSRWLFLLSPIVPALYFIISEPLTHTSPGKWVFGYIINHGDGTPVSFSGSVVRTFMRLFDMNPVGLVSIWLSHQKQRPGDLTADTVVTRQRRSWPGGAMLLGWVIVSSLVLWTGLQNNSSFLHRDNFRYNFIPTLEAFGDVASESIYKNPTITNFRFASDDSGTIRTPAVFYPGETVYIIFDFYGYIKMNRMVWVQEDLDIKYPDGSTALHQENIIDYNKPISSKGPIELQNKFIIPDNAPSGEYVITVTVRDLKSASGVRLVDQKMIEVKNPYLPQTPPPAQTVAPQTGTGTTGTEPSLNAPPPGAPPLPPPQNPPQVPQPQTTTLPSSVTPEPPIQQ